MGSLRSEPSPKITILDTPKASAAKPRQLARPEPPTLQLSVVGEVACTTAAVAELDGAQAEGKSMEETRKR